MLGGAHTTEGSTVVPLESTGAPPGSNTTPPWPWQPLDLQAEGVEGVEASFAPSLPFTSSFSSSLALPSSYDQEAEAAPPTSSPRAKAARTADATAAADSLTPTNTPHQPAQAAAAAVARTALPAGSRAVPASLIRHTFASAAKLSPRLSYPVTAGSSPHSPKGSLAKAGVMSKSSSPRQPYGPIAIESPMLSPRAGVMSRASPQKWHGTIGTGSPTCSPHTGVMSRATSRLSPAAGASRLRRESPAGNLSPAALSRCSPAAAVMSKSPGATAHAAGGVVGGTGSQQQQQQQQRQQPQQWQQQQHVQQQQQQFSPHYGQGRQGRAAPGVLGAQVVAAVTAADFFHREASSSASPLASMVITSSPAVPHAVPASSSRQWSIGVSGLIPRDQAPPVASFPSPPGVTQAPHHMAPASSSPQLSAGVSARDQAPPVASSYFAALRYWQGADEDNSVPRSLGQPGDTHSGTPGRARGSNLNSNLNSNTPGFLDSSAACDGAPAQQPQQPGTAAARFQGGQVQVLVPNPLYAARRDSASPTRSPPWPSSAAPSAGGAAAAVASGPSAHRGGLAGGVGSGSSSATQVRGGAEVETMGACQKAWPLGSLWGGLAAWEAAAAAQRR